MLQIFCTNLRITAAGVSVKCLSILILFILAGSLIFQGFFVYNGKILILKGRGN